MKKFLFFLGVILLILSVLEQPTGAIKNSSLIVFLYILLLALFDDLQEFDFFGMLKGKKTEKKLQELAESIDKNEQATNPSQTEMDDLTKLRTKSINLMSIDRGNFLALVFEIERLLRLVAMQLYKGEVEEKTSPKKIIELLKKKEYLTENGVLQLNALSEVRNLIVHGRVSVEEDQKLGEWTELAYNLYKEINNDIYGPKNSDGGGGKNEL